MVTGSVSIALTGTIFVADHAVKYTTIREAKVRHTGFIVVNASTNTISVATDAVTSVLMTKADLQTTEMVRIAIIAWTILNAKTKMKITIFIHTVIDQLRLSGTLKKKKSKKRLCFLDSSWKLNPQNA